MLNGEIAIDYWVNTKANMRQNRGNTKDTTQVEAKCFAL